MNNDQIIIYQSEDGSSAIEVKVQSDTVWLTRYQPAELFSGGRTPAGRLIRNICKTNVPDENPTCANFATVETEQLIKAVNELNERQPV